LFQNSQRIVSDIIRWRTLMQDSGLAIVLRKFEPIPLWCEFRAFVKDRRIVAVSQYFSELYFPELQGEKVQKEMLERLDAFYARLIPKLPLSYKSFILDVKIDQKSVKLIELNPYGELTGAGLFDWKDDSDLLMGNRQNCEFRVRTAPLDLVLTGVWKDSMDVALQKAGGTFEAEFEESAIVV
jgi:hypothetical protein